ncbi:hypothetical protein ATCC90586_009700 [Pythium insidiosum]|nr:hypothetical protein ATCC90586_009700 [Pythium insidiosum]
MKTFVTATLVALLVSGTNADAKTTGAPQLNQTADNGSKLSGVAFRNYCLSGVPRGFNGFQYVSTATATTDMMLIEVNSRGPKGLKLAIFPESSMDEPVVVAEQQEESCVWQVVVPPNKYKFSAEDMKCPSSKDTEYIVSGSITNLTRLCIDDKTNSACKYNKFDADQVHVVSETSTCKKSSVTAPTPVSTTAKKPETSVAPSAGLGRAVMATTVAAALVLSIGSVL